MQDINREKWMELHQNQRYRPKYPSEMVVQFVFRNFDRDGRTKVLDLGCGAGRHVFFMGREGIVPYGLDYSAEGIRYTRQMLIEHGMEGYAPNMSVGSLTKLPYEDESFDGIICYGVLYYLDVAQINEAISEMKRVLKVGGRLLLVVRNTEDYRFDEALSLKDEKNTIIIAGQDAERCASSENGMRMHFFVEEELREYFKEFQQVEIDCIKETHGNQAFCDCNYILTAEK